MLGDDKDTLNFENHLIGFCRQNFIYAFKQGDVIPLITSSYVCFLEGG